MRPAKQGGVHTVTLKLRVHSDTKQEAEIRVMSHFPAAQWPKGSISIDKIEKGWKK